MRQSRSVRVYVVCLVVGVVLPLIVFGAFLVIRSADSEQRIITTTIHERAQVAAADLDRELRNLQEIVSILAGSYYLLVGDAAMPRRYPTNMLKDPALGFVLRDLSGQPLLDTCTVGGRPFPISRGFNDLLYSVNPNRPHISELMAEPVSGEPLLTIDLPVWRDDESVLVLSLCPLPRILQILIEQPLPDGWTVAIADSQGRPIASIRGFAGGTFTAVGDDQGATPIAANDSLIAPSGLALGGAGPGYSASSPVHLAGWTVAINVPGEIFSAPVRRALLFLVVAEGGTLTVVLIIAVTIGRRIINPLTHLATIATSVRGGGRLAFLSMGIKEADLIAQAINQRTAELTQTVEALRHRERQLRKLSDDLRQSLDERRELLNRIVSAQESERQRIARELHDQLGQYFAALLLGLDAADKVSNRHNGECYRIADLKIMTSAMSREVHQLSWELSTTMLDDFGLEAAMASYLEIWGGRFNLNVDFAGNLRGRRFSAPVEITLYRALQEAMTNIAKHARAGKVSVVLQAEAGEIRLTVEDDGIGVTDAHTARRVTPTSGLGLLGIRERLAYVGGSLIIGPASGRGTVLFCRIPT
ncbi:MAG: ATP-binding protein [Stellaceae bacterium]